jgi:hypothetical protein
VKQPAAPAPTDEPITMTNSRSAHHRSAPGLVYCERLNIRTREVASVAGRTPAEVTQLDYEQAKREVAGEMAAESKL